MRPNLKFIATDLQNSKLTRQTRRLEEWWKRYENDVFDAVDYYVYCRWNADSIQVLVERLFEKRSKASTYGCEGEVYLDQPDEIHLRVGKRVRWTGRNISVFIHELIHCATISDTDRRFTEPGLLEEWVFDELATDVLAQYILKKATGSNPKIADSIRYALVETSRLIVKDKQLRSELVKRIKRELRSYLKTEKKFFSFRRSLKNV